MILPLALGLNLWVVAVALPLLLALAARTLAETSTPLVALTALAPLVPLAAGFVARGRAQAALLLVVFPALVVLPVALAPSEAVAHVWPPSATVLAAASLVAFVGSVARAQARDERAVAVPAAVARKLHQDAPPSRWRRRMRVYRGFAVTTLAFPLVLVGAVDLSPSFAASLQTSFGAHAAHAQALATVGVGLLWIVLVRAYVLAPLHAHLQHDRDLFALIEADRRHAKRGRPRASFYIAVAVALAAMIAVVWQRSR